MAIEEVMDSWKGRNLGIRLRRLQEFSIEIPDKEADAILSSMSPTTEEKDTPVLKRLIVDKAVDYIQGQPDGEAESSRIPSSYAYCP